MRKCNPKNERVKRAYYEWQKEANKKSISSIDHIRIAIDKYETYTKYHDFRIFNKHKAVAFKKYLLQSKSIRKNTTLSKSTILSTLNNLKDFFKWLAYHNGYKRQIDIREIEYFNLSEKESRIAKTQKRKAVPTIEQISKVIMMMPLNNEIDRRNQALIAFALLTGIRDGAIASLKLKHIKPEENLVEQLAEEVKTKFSKTIYTYFLPIGKNIKQIVIDWIEYLYKIKLFNHNDPLFPRTKLGHDENNSFTTQGVEAIHWQSANQIRKIFKDAFEKANMPYFNPHSFRDTLARLGEQLCKTPEEFKAWSQNLGHEQVLTTFNSYGTIPEYRQGEIIQNIGKTPKSKNQAEEIAEYLYKIEQREKKLDI